MALVSIEQGGKATIDVKRFYFPCKVTATCPVCGAEVVRDFEDRYESYPTVNTPIEIAFHHYTDGEQDEHEWYEEVVIRLTVERPE